MKIRMPWSKAIARDFVPIAVGDKLSKGTCLVAEGPEAGVTRNFAIADEQGTVIWTGDQSAFAKLVRDAARRQEFTQEQKAGDDRAVATGSDAAGTAGGVSVGS